jgi:hypothetical protein
MEIKTTEQIQYFGHTKDTKWVKVDDIKNKLHHILDYVELQDKDIENVILKLFNELSQSNPAMNSAVTKGITSQINVVKRFMENCIAEDILLCIKNAWR